MPEDGPGPGALLPSWRCEAGGPGCPPTWDGRDWGRGPAGVFQVARPADARARRCPGPGRLSGVSRRGRDPQQRPAPSRRTRGRSPAARPAAPQTVGMRRSYRSACVIRVRLAFCTRPAAPATAGRIYTSWPAACRPCAAPAAPFPPRSLSLPPCLPHPLTAPTALRPSPLWPRSRYIHLPATAAAAAATAGSV